ncbi:hypothetical protein Hanom_Chr01g00054381 [Helianthus anomalus]
MPPPHPPTIIFNLIHHCHHHPSTFDKLPFLIPHPLLPPTHSPHPHCHYHCHHHPSPEKRGF